MKDLFANLYNKVLSFFHQAETNNSASKDVACNRLKLVLMQDRTNLSPAIMDRMRHELVDLLSKYLELDKELLDLNFEQEDDQMALMLSIPVIRAKDEEEITEILRQEDEAKSTESETDEEEDLEDDNDEVEESELDEIEAANENEEDSASEDEDDKEDENDSDEVVEEKEEK